MRLLNMHLDLRHTPWSSLLPLACVLSACEVGPGGPLGLGGDNGGIAIGGTGGGTGADTVSFAVQPSNATAGNIITPPVQVIVRDSLGNVDTSFTAAITITIAVNPVGGTLSGTTSVAPVNGIAQFGDLSSNTPGTGYVLRRLLESLRHPRALAVRLLQPAARPRSFQAISKKPLQRWHRMPAGSPSRRARSRQFGQTA